MKTNEITIPEDLQQICRDFAEVARKHNLNSLHGNFSHKGNWGGEISFAWSSGRHFEDDNELKISTQLFVHTKVTLQKATG